MATRKKKNPDDYRHTIRFEKETYEHLNEMIQGIGAAATTVTDKAVEYYYQNHYLPNRDIMTSKAKPKKA